MSKPWLRPTLFFVSLFLCGSSLASDVEAILQAYQNNRPNPADLTVYRLDWSANLQQARERAAKERRPIFLLVVVNSYGNLYSGHC